MELSIFYKIIFFFSIFLLFYAYGGYLYLLRLITRLLRKKHIRTSDFKPKVSILIPVYNEEKVIRQKIENCLELDYPKEQLQIMVCSDCSNDKTAEIVSEYIDKGISFLSYNVRRGKTGVINASVPEAEGEIIVLTDANTMFNADAVSELISMYSSEEIGAVLGQVKLVVPEEGRGVKKEVQYREFEAFQKYAEGLLGATIGAFGGFYSIRKKVFTPLPSNAYSNDDLIIPMRILQSGYKVIFNREAISIEDTGQNVKEEFIRRVRIGAGNFQSFFLMPYLLNPFRGKIFFLYVSHKVLRWFSPMILLILLISNILLFKEYPYNIFCCMQAGFYGIAVIGALFSKMHITLPLISSIYHFVSMNVAVFFGFFRYLRGIKSAVWESTERAQS